MVEPIRVDPTILTGTPGTLTTLSTGRIERAAARRAGLTSRATPGLARPGGRPEAARLPLQTFEDSGAVFDPNTGVLTFPDGRSVVTNRPGVENRAFVVGLQQEQTLARERGLIAGFVPAGESSFQRRQRARDLRIEEIESRRAAVVTAGVLARQAVEMEEGGLPEPVTAPVPKEESFVGDITKGEPLFDLLGFVGLATPIKEARKEKDIGKRVSLIGERFIPGVPLSLSFSGVKSTITSFLGGAARKTTARQAPKAVLKVAKDIGLAVQPTVEQTPREFLKGIGASATLLAGGLAAPEAALQTSIALRPELQGVKTDSPLIRATAQNAFVKANQALFAKEKPILTEEGISFGGLVQATQAFLPPLKGATSEVFRDTFVREFIKTASTVMTKAQAKSLAEAYLDSQVFGGAAGLILIEGASETGARTIAPGTFRRFGTRTIKQRAISGFVTAAPAGILEGVAGTQVIAAAEQQQAQPIDLLTGGLFGLGTAGFFTGTAAAIAPFKGGPIIGRSFEAVDFPLEQTGNIQADFLRRLGLSLPEPRITRIRTPIPLPGAKPTPAPVPTPTPTPTPVPVAVPVEVPSIFQEPTITPTPTPTPTVTTEIIRPTPTPITPAEVPALFLAPVPIEEPVTVPVDTGVPTPISLTIPVPIVAATGFPFLPLFGFGTGTGKPKRKQRTELFNELSVALGGLFGPGFAQTIKKRSVPPIKRKKRRRKTTKPLRFI